MSERLATLLRDAADAPEPLQLREIEHLVRRNRRRRIAVAAAVVTAVVAAVVVPVAVLPDHRGPSALTATPPTPPRVVAYGHLEVTVPTGWRVTGQGCDAPQDRTVSTGPISAASCGAQGRTPELSGIALLPAGPVPTEVDPGSLLLTPTAVDGQLAYLQRAPGPPGGVQLTLQFPYLAAMVVVVAPTEAEAEALLARVSVDTGSSLQVPTTATSVDVAVRQIGRAGFTPQVRATASAQVAAVVSALRAAPLESVLGARRCSADTIVTVELPGSPTYAVSFGSCNQVVAGNGTLARATPQLKSALTAIVGAGSLD